MGTGTTRRNTTNDSSIDEQNRLFCSPLQTEMVRDVVDLHAHVFAGLRPLPGEVILACVPFDRAHLGLGVRLNFRQNWTWMGQTLGPPKATISLAPMEERTIALETRRRRMRTDTRRDVSETVRRRETSDSTRASSNTTQSSAHRRNWGFSTDGSLNIGTAQSAVSGAINAAFNLEDAVEATSQTSMENASEETQTSAEETRSQTEITVEVVNETITTNKDVRVLKNPYHDRSMTLNLFSLSDRFRIGTVPRPRRPKLMLHFAGMALDEEFVLNNASFLESSLIDSALALDLGDAVGTALRRPRNGRVDPVIRQMVRDALDLLFVVPGGIFRDFDVLDPDDLPGRWSLPRSFDAAQDNSGFGDAHREGFGRSFTAIASAQFLRTRFLAGSPSQNEADRYELDLCLALSETIQPEWRALSNGNIDNLLDDQNTTEVIRRIEGFLMIVDNLIRPKMGDLRVRTRLVEPASTGDDDAVFSAIVEPQVDESLREAERVIDRTVKHLECYASHYLEAFLRDVFDSTNGMAFRDALIGVLRQALPDDQAAELISSLDFSAAYLDGDIYAVGPVDAGAAGAWLGELGGLLDIELPSGGVDFGVGENPSSNQSYELDVDGGSVHIEPFPGHCRLPAVPPPEGDPVDLSVTVDG